MTQRNTVIRAMHDLGAAAWFGGGLMGAVGLNGAASNIGAPSDRPRIAANGWARWAPVNAAAIGAHLVGGAGLILANKGRLGSQQGAITNTVVKTALTGAALASTAYSGVLGAKIAKAGPVHAEAATTPSEITPDDVAAAQTRLKALQWATPALTAAIIVLGAQQGEQQRPSQVARGLGKKRSR